jgi:glycosyltransferase involved in cell wall biosynthesis
MTISAICPVYNEEVRIEMMLRCAAWCDEIVVLDKCSTDKTREIASRYTDKILILSKQEYDANEWQITWQRLLDNVTSEWVIDLTASDVLHPELAIGIRKLIEQDDFPYDVIRVPYRRYVLGLETKHSPWYSEFDPAVFRKRVASINQDDVHSALTFDTKRYYKMPNSSYACMYHLTHSTVDIMMERHLRYCRSEGKLYPPNQSLVNATKPVIKSAFHILFKNKSYLMGWDGVALAMAYITYWLLRFVYIWERRRSRAPEVYDQIRQDMVNAWQEKR